MTELTPPRRRFLTARWHNLILANYATPDELLTPYLPPGIELDRYQGSGYCSLVAFQFRETRVLGVSWPGFRHFPEWNLRIYARSGADRGVVFVREFVPQWLVASVARATYNEPYRRARLTEAVDESGQAITVEYGVQWAGRRHSLAVVADKPAAVPDDASEAHFFKEQTWGFGVSHFGTTLRYRVMHPAWAVYPVRESRADLDWAALYGQPWAAMQSREPNSVFLAAGSAVSVYPHRRTGLESSTPA